MSPKKLTAKDRVARALRDLDLDDLKQDARKTESILLRVTEAEKQQVQAVAAALGLSVSEYLLALHREVARRPT